MRRLTALPLVMVLFCVTAARGQWVSVSKDGKGFVRDDGRAFVVWGFNYDRDYRSRLIEEYWGKEWGTVESDFREMRDLGADTVRVHISFAHFMTSPEKANEENLARLEKLVRLAEDLGVYIDLTGLGCYRKEDVPKWFDSMSEKDRWAAQANFWAAVSERLKDRPGVLAYDLINEPIAPTEKPKPGDWMAGHLGDFWYCPRLTLDPAGRDIATIAKSWTKQMVAAIRAHDRRHMITIGMLPIGIRAEDVAPDLDYISVHVYPERGKVADAVATAKRFAVPGKPLVIEETWVFSCGDDELEQFIRESRPLTAGYLGFYWGQTMDELKASKEIGDAFELSWLKLFQKLTPMMTGATTKPAAQ